MTKFIEWCEDILWAWVAAVSSVTAAALALYAVASLVGWWR